MDKQLQNIQNKWLVLPVIVLAANFVWRLIDESQIMRQFPFDFVNDVSSYMAQLHFLKVCGFLKFCPFWYNGFIAFKFTPPAWYFFTYPLYLLFGDVKIATYASMLLIFVLAFAAIWYFGRLFNLSRIKRLAFFLFLFANAISIGNFIRSGRIPELFAWLNFVIFAFILLWYKDRPLDKKYLLTIPFLAIIILSHQVVAVLSFVALSGLFLIKNMKEKLAIIASATVAIAATSFWLLPYAIGFSNSGVVGHVATAELFNFDKLTLPQNIATLIVPIALWVLFYFYWQSHNKSKKELIFFSPILLTSALLFFRLTYFVPILKYVYPDPHMVLFLFAGLFMFFKTNFSKSLNFEKLISICIIFTAMLSVAISVFYTPGFSQHTVFDAEMLTALNSVNPAEKFLILGTQKTSYSKAYYAYASTYLGLSSASGWYPEVKDNSYMTRLRSVGPSFDGRTREEFSRHTSYLNATTIISYYDGCKVLADFGWTEIKSGAVCLYS